MTIFLGIVFWAVVIMWVAHKASETGTKVGTSMTWRAIESERKALDARYGRKHPCDPHITAFHPRWEEYKAERDEINRKYGV